MFCNSVNCVRSFLDRSHISVVLFIFTTLPSGLFKRKHYRHYTKYIFTKKIMILYIFIEKRKCLSFVLSGNGRGVVGPMAALGIFTLFWGKQNGEAISNFPQTSYVTSNSDRHKRAATTFSENSPENTTEIANTKKVTSPKFPVGGIGRPCPRGWDGI